MGGNSLIGRQLYPLLKKSNYDNVNVSPRMIYVDSSKPELVEGFTKNTFIAMVKGVKEQAIRSGLMEETSWDQGIRDLYKATGEDGRVLTSAGIPAGIDMALRVVVRRGDRPRHIQAHGVSLSGEQCAQDPYR